MNSKDFFQNKWSNFKAGSPKRRLTTLAGLAGVVSVIAFIISSGLAPAHKISKIREQVYNDSLFMVKYGEDYKYNEISPLLKEKAYKTSLLELSKQDSIQLAINLPDSLVVLVLKGVEIHSVPVKIEKVDPLLIALTNLEYFHMFSSPVQIINQKSTIIKEPIVVRHAPKDTAEANLNAYKPDTLIQNPAFLQLSLQNGIRIILEQENMAEGKDYWTKRGFYISLAAKKFTGKIVDFVSFKNLEYEPVIKITMPANDIRAIYRALPENSFLALIY